MAERLTTPQKPEGLRDNVPDAESIWGGAANEVSEGNGYSHPPLVSAQNANETNFLLVFFALTGCLAAYNIR